MKRLNNTQDELRIAIIELFGEFEELSGEEKNQVLENLSETFKMYNHENSGGLGLDNEQQEAEESFIKKYSKCLTCKFRHMGIDENQFKKVGCGRNLEVEQCMFVHHEPIKIVDFLKQLPPKTFVFLCYNGYSSVGKGYAGTTLEDLNKEKYETVENGDSESMKPYLRDDHYIIGCKLSKMTGDKECLRLMMYQHREVKS